jgi:hypothetical protein
MPSALMTFPSSRWWRPSAHIDMRSRTALACAKAVLWIAYPQQDAQRLADALKPCSQHCAGSSVLPNPCQWWYNGTRIAVYPGNHHSGDGAGGVASTVTGGEPPSPGSGRWLTSTKSV